LVIHFGFDAPEAAAELTQGDEQPDQKFDVCGCD
jgi:hypothetical protein